MSKEELSIDWNDAKVRKQNPEGGIGEAKEWENLSEQSPAEVFESKPESNEPHFSLELDFSQPKAKALVEKLTKEISAKPQFIETVQQEVESAVLLDLETANLIAKRWEESTDQTPSLDPFLQLGVATPNMLVALFGKTAEETTQAKRQSNQYQAGTPSGRFRVTAKENVPGEVMTIYEGGGTRVFDAESRYAEYVSSAEQNQGQTEAFYKKYHDAIYAVDATMGKYDQSDSMKEQFINEMLTTNQVPDHLMKALAIQANGDADQYPRLLNQFISMIQEKDLFGTEAQSKAQIQELQTKQRASQARAVINTPPASAPTPTVPSQREAEQAKPVSIEQSNEVPIKQQLDSLWSQLQQADQNSPEGKRLFDRFIELVSPTREADENQSLDGQVYLFNRQRESGIPINDDQTPEEVTKKLLGWKKAPKGIGGKISSFFSRK